MPQTSVERIDPADGRALRRFVRLERRLAGGYPFYAADPDADVAKRLTGRSPFLAGATLALFVAREDGDDVGRCCAVINPAYQAAHGDPSVGFIGHYAAAPDASRAVVAMLAEAEAWLRDRGVTRVLAPYDGSLWVGAIGVRTADYGSPPAFPMPWQPPHYAQYLRDAGYSPAKPLHSYEVDLTSTAYRAFAERAGGNPRVTVRPLGGRTLRADLAELARMVDETFDVEWEYSPAPPRAVAQMVKGLRLLTGPELLVLGELDGRPAGFLWALPDFGGLMRWPRRVGPVRLARAMVAGRRYRELGLLMMGVRREHRGHGVAQAMTAHLLEKARARGLHRAYYHWVNNANAASRGFAESMGGVGTVLWHVFEKRV